MDKLIKDISNGSDKTILSSSIKLRKKILEILSDIYLSNSHFKPDAKKNILKIVKSISNSLPRTNFQNLLMMRDIFGIIYEFIGPQIDFSTCFLGFCRSYKGIKINYFSECIEKIHSWMNNLFKNAPDFVTINGHVKPVSFILLHFQERPNKFKHLEGKSYEFAFTNPFKRGSTDIVCLDLDNNTIYYQSSLITEFNKKSMNNIIEHIWEDYKNVPIGKVKITMSLGFRKGIWDPEEIKSVEFPKESIFQKTTPNGNDLKWLYYPHLKTISWIDHLKDIIVKSTEISFISYGILNYKPIEYKTNNLTDLPFMFEMKEDMGFKIDTSMKEEFDDIVETYKREKKNYYSDVDKNMKKIINKLEKKLEFSQLIHPVEHSPIFVFFKDQFSSKPLDLCLLKFLFNDENKDLVNSSIIKINKKFLPRKVILITRRSIYYGQQYENLFIEDIKKADTRKIFIEIFDSLLEASDKNSELMKEHRKIIDIILKKVGFSISKIIENVDNISGSFYFYYGDDGWKGKKVKR